MLAGSAYRLTPLTPAHCRTGELSSIPHLCLHGRSIPGHRTCQACQALHPQHSTRVVVTRLSRQRGHAHRAQRSSLRQQQRQLLRQRCLGLSGHSWAMARRQRAEGGQQGVGRRGSVERGLQDNRTGGQSQQRECASLVPLGAISKVDLDDHAHEAGHMLLLTDNLHRAGTAPHTEPGFVKQKMNSTDNGSHLPAA
jgi:hypothetical protein